MYVYIYIYICISIRNIRYNTTNDNTLHLDGKAVWFIYGVADTLDSPLVRPSSGRRARVSLSLSIYIYRERERLCVECAVAHFVSNLRSRAM